MELQAIKHSRLLTKNPLLISKDSKYIICYCRNIIQIFSCVTGETIRTLLGHRNSISHCQINPYNFLQLISCSVDGQIIYWDYDAGTQLKVLNANFPIWRVMLLPNDESAVYMIRSSKKLISKKKETPAYVIQAKLSPENQKIQCIGNILFSVKSNPKYCQMSPDGSYIASIAKRSLRIYDIKTGKLSKFNRRNRLTCIAIHPSEDCIATGDRQGKIILWRRYRNSNQEPIQLELHWHAHPLLDIQYNIDGSCLLSGGSESVLVLWHLRTETKRFLPRLGSSILHINSSHDYSIVAVSLKDNVIRLISPSDLAITQSIQGLHKVCDWYQSSPVPTGLVFDPRSRTIVLNSIPGSLQFYDVRSHKTTNLMDVVGENYIVSHNNKPTNLTQVTHVAFYSNGNWLATIESRNSSNSVTEMKLKFWEFSEISQSYILNTSVEPPHTNFVTAIIFRPENDSSAVPDQAPMLVTTDSAGFIKTWLLNFQIDAIRDDKPSWICHSISRYRDSSAKAADFSYDSSLLGVAYDEIVTLWDPNRNEIQKTLSHLVKSEKVQHIAFGNKQCSHLLTTTTARLLCVWSLLSCTIQWCVQLRVSLLTKSPSTSHLAALIKGKNSTSVLYVFSPDESKSLAVLRDFSNQQVISATFLPVLQRSISQKDSWLYNQRYYFITNSQDLYSLEPEDSPDTINEERIAVKVQSDESPFVRIFGEFEDTPLEQRQSEIVDLTYRTQYSRNVREIFAGATYVMPSMTTVCSQFIKSSLETVTTADIPNRQPNGVYESDSESDIESVNSDEENIVNRENSDTERLNEEESMEIEKDAHDLNNVEMNFDWMHEFVSEISA